MNSGGPAFPRSLYKQGGQPFNDSSLAEGYGMTLRDYFASRAMPAYIADALRNRVVDCAEVASFAYEMADAMLKEREKSA